MSMRAPLGSKPRSCPARRRWLGAPAHRRAVVLGDDVEDLEAPVGEGVEELGEERDHLVAADRAGHAVDLDGRVGGVVALLGVALARARAPAKYSRATRAVSAIGSTSVAIVVLLVRAPCHSTHKVPPMTAPARKREVGRGERLLPGVWRLRLPLPWPGVPHCNAWAVAAGRGIVLFDTGMHQPGSMANLERALEMVGLKVEHVRLVVCTHAHSDHYGQAASIVERAGCELWMHPDHAHMTANVDDPDAAVERRLEIARSAGVPEEPLRQWPRRARASRPGSRAIVEPARGCCPA